MKFLLHILPTIPASDEERCALRPIGRNTERYQMMLEEVRQLAVMADELGFDAMSMTEHHFHSEGFEVSPAPLLLFADLAARTKRIKFLPLGLVLPTRDPIRTAEELAVLDQLTTGRVLAGFARGNQSRWSNVLGQKYRTEAAGSDQSAADVFNRTVAVEFLDLVARAWQEDCLSFDGEHYKVPFPHEGIPGWPPAETTRRLGAPGEVDDAGTVRAVSVVPRPYQEPTPPMFQPFTVSEETVRYTAANGIVPYILTAYPPDFRRACEIYQEVAAANGRDLKLGQQVAAVRAVHFGETEDDAMDLLRRTHVGATWNQWLGIFGYWEAFRRPEDAEKYPLDPYTPLPRSEWTAERFCDVRYAYAGTPDNVRRGIEELHSVYGDGELEWFGWFFDQGLMPLEDQKRQIELFAKHIISNFR